MSSNRTKSRPKTKAKTKRRRKARHASGGSGGVIAAIAAFVIVIAAYGGIGFYFSGHFLPGTTVNNVDVSLMTTEQAKSELIRSLNDYKLTLNELDSKKEVIKGSDIGLTASISSEFDNMLDIQTGLAWALNIFMDQNHEMPEGVVAYEYDDDMLDEAIDSLECVAPQYPVEMKNAEIVLSDDGFVISPENIGNTAHRDELREGVADAALNGEESIDLLEGGFYDMPEVYADDPILIEQKSVYDELNDMVISLKFGSKTVPIGVKSTSKWVKPGKNADGSFKLNLITNEIKAYVSNLADTYDTFGKTKMFKSHSGDVIEVNPGGYGWLLDQDFAVDKLKGYVQARKSVSIDLTDGSEESNEWWYRKAVAYDTEGTNYYGNTYAEVSIGQQHMWMYQDGKQIYESDVVTGNPNLGNSTPTGAFRIVYHQAPATLRGPGYVTDVAYWMVFADDVGFHDATWQPYFGGDLYLSNGSHGCVNLPLSKAAELYELVYDGLPVFVY